MKKLITTVVALILLGAAPAASAQDYSGPDLGAGVFSAPAVAGPGSKVTFEANGLLPGADVEVLLISGDGAISVLDSTEVQGLSASRLSRTVADESGAVKIVVTLPENLGEGTYTLEVRSTKADGSEFVSRVSFTTGQAIAANDALARTGTSSTNYVQIAGMSMLLGLGLLLVAKRKKPEPIKVDA